MVFGSSVFRRTTTPSTSAAPFALPDLWPQQRDHARAQVGVLVYQGVTTAEIDEPARTLADGLDADVVHIAVAAEPVVDVEPVRTVQVTVTTSDPRALRNDVLVIPGGLGWERLVDDLGLMAWVTHASKAAHGVLAISTGSLILASAGRLAGHAATGHRLARDALSALGAQLHTGRTAQSEDHRTVTAAGALSAIEAAVDLAERVRWGPA